MRIHTPNVFQRLRVLYATLALAPVLPVHSDSTINSENKFAYAANAGWINFRHDQPNGPAGIVFGDYFLAGYAYAANFGWIDFGNGAPADGIRYSNTDGTDFGVNHDGLGMLSGLAYGANIGWINFGWSNSPVNYDRPKVDLRTGAFSGYAYSANLGWINLGTGVLTTDTMACIDSDSDGIADAWEMEVFGDLVTATADSNFDHDPASDLEEYLARTTANDNSDYFRLHYFSFFDVEFDGLKTTLASIAFTSHPSRFYRVEVSDNLGIAPDMWTDSGLGLIAPFMGAGDPLTFVTAEWPTTNRKFLRVIAVKPLP